MIITAFLTKDAIQFNLEPESDHEKKFMKMFQEYTGYISTETGVDIGMSQGGYLRNYGTKEEITTITIARQSEKVNPELLKCPHEVKDEMD